MALSRLEHFTRFGTDSAGIERMLRMVQAILMVVLSQPFLARGFTKLVAWGNQHVWDEPRVADFRVLDELRCSLALARRPLRFFRFLDSFQAAHVIYTSFHTSPSPPLAPAGAAPAPAPAPAPNGDKAAVTEPGEQTAPPTHDARARAHNSRGPPPTRRPRPFGGGGAAAAAAEAWLDLLARTFNGMYLLLEALTLPDALMRPGGFSLLGRAWFARLTVEAQRFWLFALVCGIGSAGVRLCKLVGSGPAPVADEAYVGWPGPGSEGRGKAEGEMAEWERQRERMRRLVWTRREGRRLWIGEMKTVGWRIARRGLADVLDLVVPGVVVGWVRLEPGTVGLCMLVSTWLTAAEIWERCGQ